MTDAASMLVTGRLKVNGRGVTASVDARTSLATFLRDHLRLMGTRMGCDTAQCGACTVLLDGKSVKSCNVLVAQVHERNVTTIEGLVSEQGELHPLQECFRSHHALQCGFCTSGMVMRAYELLTTLPDAPESSIRDALDGNLCRCTGYHNIVAAVSDAMSQRGCKQPKCVEYPESDDVSV